MSNDAGPRQIPSGGWSYPEHGDRAEPLRAGGLEELIDLLIADRVANQRELGSPANDIQKYLEQNNPGFPNYMLGTGPAIPTSAPQRSLRDRVTAWLAARYSLRASGNTDLVSQEEASRRAAICSACPKNQALPNDCPPCKKSQERTGFLLRQGASTGKNLEVCGITGQDNEVAAFLPESLLAHRKRHLTELKKETPNCWLIDL